MIRYRDTRIDGDGWALYAFVFSEECQMHYCACGAPGAWWYYVIADVDGQAVCLTCFPDFLLTKVLEG